MRMLCIDSSLNSGMEHMEEIKCNDDSRRTYQYWIPDDQKAAACIQCEECLSKCPQQIPISSWLPVVEEVLGLNRAYVSSL